MNIAGFQSLSLLDYPHKSCAIIFTQGCAFRCPYCHNPDLIPVDSDHHVSEHMVINKLIQHREMLDGVCITGGEPTLQPDLKRFIGEIKKLGLLVKLDTNGVHPKVVRSLLDDNLLDYIAMDLKNAWPRYLDIIKTGGDKVVQNCQDSFRIIQESGVPHEFRTTICPGVHREEDFFEMLSYLKPQDAYFIQDIRFGKLLDQNLTQVKSFDYLELVEKLSLAYPAIQITAR